MANGEPVEGGAPPDIIDITLTCLDLRDTNHNNEYVFFAPRFFVCEARFRATGKWKKWGVHYIWRWDNVYPLTPLPIAMGKRGEHALTRALREWMEETYQNAVIRQCHVDKVDFQAAVEQLYA